MTAAFRWKSLGWFGGCVIVTLGFYLVSLQVAAERKRLEQVDARIVSAERDVRALETEFDTRANLVQLERWNGDTLALVAPTAGQFVRSEAQLASISFDGSSSQPAIQTAALVVPTFTAQAPRVIEVASPVTIAPVVTTKVGAVEPVRRSAPIAVASVVNAVESAHDRAASAGTAAAIIASIAKPAATRKAQAVAMLDRTLLSDSTLGDLLSGARSEARLR